MRTSVRHARRDTVTNRIECGYNPTPTLKRGPLTATKIKVIVCKTLERSNNVRSNLFDIANTLAFASASGQYCNWVRMTLLSGTYTC